MPNKEECNYDERAECMRTFGRLEAKVCEHRELTDRELVAIRDIMHSLQDVTNVKIDAINDALKLASYNLGDKLAHLNNIQAILKDQTNTMVTRNEWAAEHRRLVDDISSLNRTRAEVEGKASMKVVFFASIPGIIALLIGIIEVASKISP